MAHRGSGSADADGRSPSRATGPRLTRRALLGSGGAALAAGLAGCTSGDGDGGADTTDESPGTTPGGATVTMVASRFDPRTLAVETGATVTWVNEDGSAHTVTAASENWALDEEVPAGGRTSHTFETPGVYDAYCEFHGTPDLDGMSMRVAVGGATVGAPLGGDETTTATDRAGGGPY